MQLSIECFNSIDLVAVCKYYLSLSLSLSLFCYVFFPFLFFFLVCGSGAEDFGKQKGETRIGSRSKKLFLENPFAKSTTGVVAEWVHRQGFRERERKEGNMQLCTTNKVSRSF
jgi:hypothetical protein